jgi:hypothetical protein
MPGTNDPAYYEKSKLTAAKSFITLTPGENVKKLFLFNSPSRPNVIKLVMSVMYVYS